MSEYANNEDIINSFFPPFPDYEFPKGWWTSGNYIARNRKWMWTTKHHLKDIKYSRWAPGEPDARSTMHCMIMYKNARYMWHDATCSDKHNFICEIELMWAGLGLKWVTQHWEMLELYEGVGEKGTLQHWLQQFEIKMAAIVMIGSNPGKMLECWL